VLEPRVDPPRVDFANVLDANIRSPIVAAKKIVFHANRYGR
jgi:hypothetical protein